MGCETGQLKRERWNETRAQTRSVAARCNGACGDRGNGGCGGNPQPTYTCTKSKSHGKPDVRVSIPESAVGGLTNAGFVCVADTPEEEGQDEQSQDEQSQGDEGPADESSPEDDPDSKVENVLFFTETLDAPSESRSLFCSTKGRVESDDGSGVALNLPDSQGALLVGMGLATPAIFYAGIGVSCDVLPGFEYSGVWVDHVGDVVPGVAVYPYYVPTTT
jgi:hypothetical protein